MSILAEYRRRRPANTKGYRNAVRLGLLLVIVVGSGYAFRTRYQQQPQPAGLALRVPDADKPSSPPPPAGDVAADTDAAAKWTPLSPEGEIELLGEVVDQRPLYLREHRDAYYYLLGKARSMSDDDFREAVDQTITYADYESQPAIIRGSTAEVTGQLLWLTKTQLDARVAPLTHVYEGQLLDSDMRLYWFVLTAPPRDPFVPDLVTLKQDLHATLRGIFMQVIVYRTRDGEDTAVPFLIGRRLEPREGLSGGGVGMPSWPWLAAFAAVVVGIFLAFARATFRRPAPRLFEASSADIEKAAADLRPSSEGEDARKDATDTAAPRGDLQ